MTDKETKDIELARVFTEDGMDPLDAVEWMRTDVKIWNRDGTIQFEMKGVEAPAAWSEQAVTIAASKYLKRASAIDGGKGETSVRALIERVADTLAEEGRKQGYLKTVEMTKIFRDELAHLLVNQVVSFNSPVWFNCGLSERYGMTGDDSHNFAWDAKKGQPISTKDYFSRPQLSACFIQSIEDDLNDIWDHVAREGRIFKGGSGTGSNFSSLRSRGERLSTGGTSSGVLSFLEVFDKVAGSTKSGGTNRRAAKMVILNADHPEIEAFIDWKMREEEKAKVLVAAGFSSGMDGEAYRTVSGQNSNNSVRVTDEFMQAVVGDREWDLRSITNGETVKTIRAKDLFDRMCKAAWHCADPGLQYDTTINDWHTCPKSGKLNASNPCGEYHFLDNSSCNLASINLTKFLSDGKFDVDGFRHVCELLIVAQDIIVDYASYPTSPICENTHNFRALGLGYCNLGSLVMRMGFPYDSEESRAVAAAITSIMTGAAYAMSARLAAAMGPFDAYQKNRAAMVKVVEKHRSKAAGIQQKMCPEYLLDASQEAWEEARDLGKAHGFRNAQVTLLAPTGTISFTMDADTTGIEPAYALVAFKTYAGGGYAKLVIDSVVPALETLGYHEAAIDDIRRYIVGHGNIRQNGSQDGVNVVRLKQIGFTDEVLAKVNSRIPNSPDLDSAIEAVPEAKVLIDSFLERGGFDAADRVGERPLKMLGFSDDEVREANEYCCGHMTVQGAPHIKPQHLPVFDCASSPGSDGTGTISPPGHIGMMSAVQPFLSGAISKTVNLSNSATVSDIRDVYLEAWNRGLKCITIYRDGCKTDQPLSVKQKVKKAIPTDGRPRRQEPPTFMDTGGRRKVQIDKYTLYVHAYRNPKDHKVNEVWVNVKPGGGPLAGMMDVTCRLISMLLQYGVPLEELVKKFAFTSFEPAGLTTHPKIPTCRSIADLIFRTLAIDFLGDESYAGKVGDDAVLAIEEIADTMSSYDGGTTAAIANGDDCCPNCGSSDLKPTGNCKACIHCGTSLGCS